MEDIKIVSYPRSGHHMLEKILYIVFKQLNLEYSYCEYYTHCGVMPCSEKRLFQKDHMINHDCHTYSEKFKKSQKIIVLYRSDTIYQLEAFFRYRRKENFSQNCYEKDNRVVVNYNYNKKNDYSNKKLFKELIDFIKEHYSYHKDWKKNIVECEEYKNSIIIEYYDFLKEPVKYIKDILRLYDPNLCYEDDILSKVIEDIGLIKNNKKLDDITYSKIKEMLNI